MKRFLLATSLLLLVGCQTTEMRADKEADISTNSKISYVNGASLAEQENIEVPAGYNVKEFVKLKVAPYVINIAMDKQPKSKMESPSATIDTGMPAELLATEFSRSERFIVLSRTCDACDEEVAYQAVNTVADGAIQQGEALNPDYVLQMKVLLGYSIKRVNDSNGAYYAITYKSTVDSKLINPTTKEIVHAFAPIRRNLEPKKFAYSKSRGYLGGFKYFDKEVANQAYQDATALSVQVLASQVMNHFPVGGKAKNYKKSKFSLNVGSNQGIPKQGIKIPAVIFLDDDGITTAMASGYIIPGGEDASQFHVLQWKTNDPEVVEIKSELDAMGKEYLKRNKVYAVSLGMPEGWEN